jgi:hypothetical protein
LTCELSFSISSNYVVSREHINGTLRNTEELELVRLERLVHILKGLSPAELETIEILLDEEAAGAIAQSLDELDAGKRIPLDEW